jgi:hypothetical protein
MTHVSQLPPALLAAGSAEAARSLLVTGTTLRLSTDGHQPMVVVGGYSADPRGRILLRVPHGHRLAGLGELPSLVQVVDTAPVSVRDRIRGELRMSGWLETVDPLYADRLWAQAVDAAAEPAHASLLRFEPVQIELLTAGRCVDVDPDAYASAAPDPIARHEADLLQHLAAGHPLELAGLAQLLPKRIRRDCSRIVPLRLNRRALVLRVEHPGGPTDVALALPVARRQSAPTTPEGVLAALRQLLSTCCGGHEPS